MPAAFIFYTILFFTLVVFPAALILVVLLFLEHERKLWQRIKPVIGPIGRMLARSPRVAGIGARFPHTMRFLAHRLDPRDPWGMPATLAGVAMVVGLWFFLGVLQDLVAKDPLVILDIRLHNAVPLFRTAGMTRFMLVLTELGGAAVLSLLCLGIALRALARGRLRLAATFMLALGGTGLISLSLKTLIGNARPIDALISMQDASFPSGHMLSGAVVYGLLAALLLGSRVRHGLRALGVTVLLLVIVGIGLSRLYLGVHWPSDLLGSLALALIGIAALLFFLYYPQPIRGIDTFKLPLSPRVICMAGNTVLVVALGATAMLASQAKVILIEPPLASHSLDIQALRAALPPGLPRWSEDLIGGRMEPISLVLVGSEDDILGAFTRAGWALADPPTPVRVLQEGIAALRNLPDPTGPATPAFFMDRPQSFTFEKSDLGSPTIRRRHHTRLWQTLHCLVPNCRRVWVATVSFDVGMRFSERLYLPTHRIDPALDAERALIAAELVQVGATQEGTVTVSPPLHGKNAAGDPFWTDGRAVVLVMP
ncbi:MAG: LssY C-terminal domain-containing protein [Polaromonas sp.]|uniref:LssY C-terminal domain-containing protein n=1 Tax=Polaromonas sp. TaxID=1869339 RepID=UPI002733F7C1|nr:LssY C-terminal domain-containing protein [Polaromonas sp.]MDP2817654.1 LssY C-terminal domain-containing protein [Polaromonas sp.]